MKRHLLFLIGLFFTLNLTAQVIDNTHLASTEYQEVDVDKNCDEEAELEGVVGYEYDREEPLRIYPNPTAEYISVTDNSTVAYLYVYNIIGRRVKAFPVFGGGQYSLGDLPDGMYLISLVDANGKNLKTVRTSKSVPRP